MIFNIDEKIILIASLEEFHAKKAAPVFRRSAEFIDDMRCTCLNKLEHLSILTYFTKQEYTVMCVALNDVIQKLLIADYEVPDGYYELFDKLETLADPDET